MATISQVRHKRLVNPGKRKRNGSLRRKLSPLQKLFFGSKRQRAAVKANRGKRRKVNAGPRSFRKTKKAMRKRGSTMSSSKYMKQALRVGRAKRRGRKMNVGSIVTVLPFGNPGKKRRVNKGMAKRRKARKHNVVYRKRVKRGVYQYTSNPGRRRRRRTSNVSVRRYRRHRNPSMRRHHRRRNPGIISGTTGSVLGVLGGVAVTKFLSGFLPAAFSTGVMGYVGTAVIAVAQGKLIGKVAKNQQLGHSMMVGGLAYLTARVLSDFFPSIGGAVGISGMGLIGGSQFYVPQVNQGGNMGSFVPVGQPTMLPAASTQAKAIGTLRRTGRLM